MMDTVYNEMVRPSKVLIEGFQEVLAEYSPSCLVTDAQRRGGAIGGLYPVKPHHKLVGPALTINLAIDDLVDCMPVLTRAEPGDVIVVACHECSRTAMWGALMSTLSLRADVAGALVDGAIRDVDEIRDLDFQIWSRGTVPRPSPTAVHDRTEPVQVNVPVVIDGQVIRPGDIVVADENGVAVVAAAQAQAVLAATRLQISRERMVREKIASGATVKELIDELGHL